MHDLHGTYHFESVNISHAITENQGDVYEGSFVQDQFSGHGKLIHVNGDYYEGCWENGLKDGYGIYDLMSIGLKYQGQWVKVSPLFLISSSGQNARSWIHYLSRWIDV